jgi:hypothetical protein
MIKLTGLVGLKPLHEAEGDNYTHIGYGKYKEKGKEKDPNSPTFKKDDSGKYIPTKGGKAAKGGDSSAEKAAPKVNIFDKPSKEEPKSEPSQPKRQGNPQVNKATLAKAKKLGITPEKLGKEEYQKKMAQAAIEALTDSNFHSEARELVAKLEGKPELAEKPDYPDVRDPKFNEKMSVIKAKYASKYTDDVDGDARKLGIGASQEAGWSGDDAVDSIAFTLRKNGFNDLADTLQSVIKENKSTRLGKLLPESLINEGTRSQVGVIKGDKIISVYVHYDGYPSNMKDGLKKHMKDEKDVMTLIKKGGARGIYDDKEIEYYGNMKPMKGDVKNIDDYVRNAGNQASADYVYLYNTSDKKWYYAKTYDDTKLKKLF